MQNITVDKAQLLKTLKKNREEHRTKFLKALEVYRQQAISELETMIDDAKNGKPIRRQVALPEPQDYTKEFDAAIEMIEWMIGNTVVLTFGEFKQYVQNEWGWMPAFTASNARYLGGEE